MLASRWIIEKIMKMLQDRERSKNLPGLKKLFGKYKDDHDMQKTFKDVEDYYKKPSPSKLRKITSDLKELNNFRKMESTGGGSMLWFSDRRAKPSRKSR
jgi:hypothetical protein